MKTYKTSEIAQIVGIHPNTVRLYEKLQLISTPQRQPNGYRVFTDLHLQQCKLVRLAFQVEVLQNGLRKKMILALKTAANGNFEQAIALVEEYLCQVKHEKQNAENAIVVVKEFLADEQRPDERLFSLKEVSTALGISTDALRNWEMNGLLNVKRKSNGYRVYTEKDVQRLKIIRALRCANYSLEAILRLLQQLSQNPNADVSHALNTPTQGENVISVCDRLIVSLAEAETNARKMLHALQKMQETF
ncbi:MAG: MerR family transcriptional regulator [Candidatus Fimimonas sp.]